MGAGAKVLFRVHPLKSILIILIHLQYINNSSLYIIQFTNGDALPKFTNGDALPNKTNGNGYVLSTNGDALPKYYGYA